MGPARLTPAPLARPPSAYPIIENVNVMESVCALQSGNVAPIDFAMIVQV